MLKVISVSWCLMCLFKLFCVFFVVIFLKDFKLEVIYVIIRELNSIIELGLV